MTKDPMNIKRLLVYALRKIIEIYQWVRVTKYCITFFGEHLAAQDKNSLKAYKILQQNMLRPQRRNLT